MRHWIFLLILVIPSLAAAQADRLPKVAAKPAGILVLDDCDGQFRDKKEYQDNLTLLDATGKQTFRISGFNNCQAIGSSHAIAVDTGRKCIWVIENVAHRIRRFDLTGKETLTINGVAGSAIAIDPETGNVWALVGDNIGQCKTVVYTDKGQLLDTHDISGWDIVYDRRSKAFWIAEKTLTKVTADKGEVLFSIDISTWSASSVDVDPRDGAAWVAVRAHGQVRGSSNRLIKFDADGNEQASVELGPKNPFKVSVDRQDGSVWVAHVNKSVQRFSVDGVSQAEYPVTAMTVQVDPMGQGVWVVTPTEVQKLTRDGEVVHQLKHAGTSLQAWILALE